jgi:hypothetical protein
MGRLGPLWFLVALVAVCLVLQMIDAYARDDGRYAAQDPALHKWFDGLRSGKGLCCSITDGRRVEDPDWGTEDGHYWVRVDGVRYSVPADAVIDEPNRAAVTLVWPYTDQDGKVQIRCFMRGIEG